MTRSTAALTVQLDEELDQELASFSMRFERDKSSIVSDALQEYLAQERRTIERIEHSLAQARRGEGIPHAEVMARMQAIIDSAIANR